MDSQHPIAAESVGDRERKMPPPPSVNVLYMGDFPPSDRAAGDLLLKRLLADYPAECVTILTSSAGLRLSSVEHRLSCEHIAYRTSNETGPWGWGRLKTAFDWARIPWLAATATRIVCAKRKRVILTVAHGHFFIAAYLAAKFTSVPYILVVHDDWVSFTKYDSLFLRFVASAVFKPIARSAAHVYAVSAEMAELLATRDGVKAEVQLPATELPPDGQGGRSMEQGQLRILYAGNIYITMEDALELLVSVVQSEEAEQQHLNCSVHIYANQTVPPEWVSRGHVVCHGWVGQKELQQALSEADVLFLPFSFREEMRFCTEHAFPSKAADYLAAAKPLLVCGPPCSTIVRYARATGIGEVVDAADRVLMLNALVRLNSADHRAELGRHAFVAFERNHDIKKQRQNFNRLLASLAQID